MIKLLSVFWPLVSIFGVWVVVFFDIGSGLESPGIWLIPIGVFGTLLTSAKLGGLKRLKWLVTVWALALFSILGLYYGWFAEGFEALSWIVPVVGFTVAGIILQFVEVIKNFKR